ncbi:MAG: 3-isopropylmalate dehydrogenase [Selenomonadaceae bacterium]|nr:3-isopropylmalate dehydrogenase [Selenomonadaceae bacterium]
MVKKIIVIPGDGIGKEITDSAVVVLKKIDEKFNIGLEFDYRDAGGAAYDKFGEPLPAETLDACKKADAVLFGAVGGKKWDTLPVDKRPEKALFGLRKGLGLFANLRPVKVYDALIDGSPLKPELVGGSDLLIVRELVGGIYFGERCESEFVDGVERAWDTEIYSVPEIERIVKLAFDSAKNRRKKITSVDKANVLASSRLWRRVVNELAKNYPEVELNHLYVDNAAMQLALNPKQFDVMVTSNMFGDILSDEAAVIGGSIGLMPSASIGELTSFYEPIHGSAPDIAGKNIANPMGTILSAAMLLRYSLDAEDAAKNIESAIDKTLADGYRTADIYKDGFKKIGTDEATEIICERL